MKTHCRSAALPLPSCLRRPSGVVLQRAPLWVRLWVAPVVVAAAALCLVCFLCFVVFAASAWGRAAQAASGMTSDGL